MNPITTQCHQRYLHIYHLFRKVENEHFDIFFFNDQTNCSQVLVHNSKESQESKIEREREEVKTKLVIVRQWNLPRLEQLKMWCALPVSIGKCGICPKQPDSRAAYSFYEGVNKIGLRW